MIYYRISENEKNLFFGKKIAQVWAVTLNTVYTLIWRPDNYSNLCNSDIPYLNRGSYMSARVLLNSLNELGKRDKM